MRKFLRRNSKLGKDLKYYRKLKYPFVVRPVTEFEDGGYIVEYPDLPFCIGTGNTIWEAVEDAEKTKDIWLEVSYEQGDEIPEPGDTGIFVKISGELYRVLANKALKEGLTVDRYIEENLKKLL